jgi:hypothetical protein
LNFLDLVEELKGLAVGVFDYLPRRMVTISGRVTERKPSRIVIRIVFLSPPISAFPAKFLGGGCL